ncbi:MAG: hypothetical protein ABIY55_35880 [Kofleriaceae bacterium]
MSVVGYHRGMFSKLRMYLRRRQYAPGARLSRFLAPDIRREIEIVDASELHAGYVRARIRTWNVLYAVRGIAAVPELAAARRVAITELWKWTGERWGGPIPNDDVSRANADD